MSQPCKVKKEVSQPCKVKKEVLEEKNKFSRRRPDDLETTRKFMKQAVQSLPPHLRSQGWLLVEKMDQRKFFLSPEGEFIPYESREKIPGSNFSDLLHFLINLFEDNTEFKRAPIGFSAFFEQLCEEDMPLQLLEWLNARPPRPKVRMSERVRPRYHSESCLHSLKKRRYC